MIDHHKAEKVARFAAKLANPKKTIQRHPDGNRKTRRLGKQKPKA